MLKRILGTVALSCAMMSGAMAQSADPIVQEIYEDFRGGDFTKVEIRVTANGYDVTASGPGGTTQRVYDAGGNVVSDDDAKNSIDADDFEAQDAAAPSTEADASQERDDPDRGDRERETGGGNVSAEGNGNSSTEGGEGG